MDALGWPAGGRAIEARSAWRASARLIATRDIRRRRILRLRARTARSDRHHNLNKLLRPAEHRDTAELS